jgi:hypothetical protein
VDEDDEHIEVEVVEVEVVEVEVMEFQEDVALPPRPIDFYAFFNGATQAFIDDQIQQATAGTSNGLRYAAQVDGSFQGFVAHTLPPATTADPSFPAGVVPERVRGRFPSPGDSLKWSESQWYETLLRVTCDGTRPVRDVTNAIIALLGRHSATEVNRSYNIVAGAGATDQEELEGLVFGVQHLPGVGPVTRHNVIRSSERP